MHWRNWIFLGIAGAIAILTIEVGRYRIVGPQPHQRRIFEPDDRKPDWYQPQETRPWVKKPVQPVGPG